MAEAIRQETPGFISSSNSEPIKIRSSVDYAFSIFMTYIFIALVPIVLKPLYVWAIEFFESRSIFFVVVLNCVITGFYAFLNLLYWFIYRIEHQFFEQYKISSEPWPWQSDPQGFRNLVKRILLAHAFNFGLVGPSVLVALEYFVGTKFRFEVAEMPTHSEILIQSVFFCLVNDFTYYWFHRFFHSAIMYKYIHKTHHEVNYAFALASQYTHSFEFISDAFQGTLGPALLGSRCHFLTVLSWFIMNVAQGIDVHSGYDFVWSPFRLFSREATIAHDNHHRYNQSNYGRFIFFWDFICGTSFKESQLDLPKKINS